MNINLSSEIISILAINSLIGLWLIWQTVKIYPGIDILKISVNWFSNRPIILPSLLFLIIPFLSSNIIHNPPPNFNNIFDNKIIAQLLTTFGTVISIYIGNRALESFRKTQEKKKIAKILIASMQSHFEILKKVSIESEISKSKKEVIERIFNKIQKDYIYETSLKSVGIFEIKYIDILSTYSRNLNDFTEEILNSYEKIPGYTNNDENKIPYLLSVSSHYLKNKLNILTMSALLNIMRLSKEILQDNDIFIEYKIKVKIEYNSQKRKWEAKKALLTEVYKDRQYNDIPQELKITQILFKEYGLLAELED